MMNYEKPVVLANEDVAEGVYAASGAGVGGSNCYTVSAYITQTPETGNETYCIHMDAVHMAEHHSTQQVVDLSFNQSVDFQWCNAANCTCSGSGSSTLTLTFSYHANFTENHGLGDVYVSSGEGLAVTGVTCTSCNMTCDQHDGLN